MRKQQHSVALFALFLYLFIAVQIHARNLQQCSSSCGDVNNIRYPFSLDTDPFDCGHLGFQLSCTNNKTILELRGGRYCVKAINYDERTIRIVDVNLANGSCALPSKSLSMEQATADSRFPSLMTFWQANYVNCSNTINELSGNRVPCLSGSQSHVYVNFSNRNLFPFDIPSTCNIISRVPTASKDEVNYPYESAMKLLATGFELRWSVECWNCGNAGLSCVYKSNDDPRIFKCETVYGYDYYYGGLLSAIAYLVSSTLFDSSFLPLVVYIFLLHKWCTMRKTLVNAHNFTSSQQFSAPRRYSYTDILALTNNFQDKLGEGRFGSVYKGQLRPNGCLVAVKMLVSSNLSEENFFNEVSALTKIQHCNVVKLLGFCCERSKHALVYEYMPNGSLDKVISSNGLNAAGPLSLEKLHQIALGIAQGIEFIHGKLAECTAHFGIKPHNILLDQNLVPKISDFGLAKLYPSKHDFASISRKDESIKYMAPELVSRNHGAVSLKSDVYSFGMLLLELASGRGNAYKDLNKVYLPSLVYDDVINERKCLEIDNVTESDSTIKGKMFIIGLWCTQTNSTDRPSMARVVEMLQGKIDDLELPPKPASFSQDIHITGPQSDSPKELLIPLSVERST